MAKIEGLVVPWRKQSSYNRNTAGVKVHRITLVLKLDTRNTCVSTLDKPSVSTLDNPQNQNDGVLGCKK